MSKYILQDHPFSVSIQSTQPLPSKSSSLLRQTPSFHMLNHFVCGTFHDQEEYGGPCSSPRKSKRKDSRDNNPYSKRGLDKFSELLVDLDQRRQKVFSQMNPHDISFVRFAYSNSNDFVPIVVKVKNKDHNKKHKNEELKARHLNPSSDEPMEKSAPPHVAVEERNQSKLESENKKAVKSSFSFNWNMLKMPSFYVPVVMISILMFLTVFGRSVATLCTCVMWYVIPLLKDSSKPRKLLKKDYVRGLSDKKMVTEGLLSPRSVDSRASNYKSSGKHAHQNSW